jgi:hypothetical protein
MATAITLISSVTVSSSTATIGFTSIPATYTDLLIKISARTSRVDDSDDLYLTFNGISSDYSTLNLQGSNGSATSDTFAGITNRIGRITQNAANNTANTFGSADIYITNYASSNVKSIILDNVQENNSTLAATTNFIGARWNYSGQPAITSITFTPNSNFVQYSTAYLYGISNA